MAFRILLLLGFVCFPPLLSEHLLTPRGTGPHLPVVIPEYGESSLELNLKFLFYSACLLFMIIISTFTLVDVIWRGDMPYWSWFCYIGKDSSEENNQVAVLLLLMLLVILLLTDFREN